MKGMKASKNDEVEENAEEDDKPPEPEEPQEPPPPWQPGIQATMAQSDETRMHDKYNLSETKWLQWLCANLMRWWKL